MEQNQWWLELLNHLVRAYEGLRSMDQPESSDENEESSEGNSIQLSRIALMAHWSVTAAPIPVD